MKVGSSVFGKGCHMYMHRMHLQWMLYLHLKLGKARAYIYIYIYRYDRIRENLAYGIGTQFTFRSKTVKVRILSYLCQRALFVIVVHLAPMDDGNS